MTMLQCHAAAAAAANGDDRDGDDVNLLLSDTSFLLLSLSFSLFQKGP